MRTTRAPSQAAPTMSPAHSPNLRTTLEVLWKVADDLVTLSSLLSKAMKTLLGGEGMYHIRSTPPLDRVSRTTVRCGRCIVMDIDVDGGDVHSSRSDNSEIPYERLGCLD